MGTSPNLCPLDLAFRDRIDQELGRLGSCISWLRDKLSLPYPKVSLGHHTLVTASLGCLMGALPIVGNEGEKSVSGAVPRLLITYSREPEMRN